MLKVVCAVGMLMALTAPAFATPIPSGTASNDLIVNFDFTGQTPPPPYTEIRIHIFISGAPNLSFAEDLYGSLDGANLLFSAPGDTTATGNEVTTTSCGSGCPDLLDGVFSVGFHLTGLDRGQGSADLTELIATATAANGGSVTLDVAVPEPGSLVLIGTALLGLGALRAFSYRRSSARSFTAPSKSRVSMVRPT